MRQGEQIGAAKLLPVHQPQAKVVSGRLNVPTHCAESFDGFVELIVGQCSALSCFCRAGVFSRSMRSLATSILSST